MKKTLTISISGFVFHIEEDAYEKLHGYLEALSSHFTGFEGRDEVISDVEARIAEILQKKISESKEVITIADVDEVISIMGQPSDFGMEEESAGSGTRSHYAALPKRLYRDGERKVFGGVCSGLGAYFNLDPVWVRVIFAFSVLISGFGLLLYLILWIVIPEARTTSEKLEMRGEPVNISTIEKSIEEEVHHIKNKLHDFQAEAKSTFYKQKERFNSQHGDQLRNSLGEVGSVILRIILIFAGLLVLFIGVVLTVVYLSILLRFPVVAVMDQAGLQAFPLYSVIERIFENDGDLRTFATGLMILTGIPLLMMLWGGLRLVFNLPRAKFISGAAGFVWICALIITLIFGFKVGNSFRHPAEYSRESGLDFLKTDTVHVMADRSLPADFKRNRSGVFYCPEMRIVISNDQNLLYGLPLIKFIPSKDSLSRLMVITSARGAFTREAMEGADKINYEWQQRSDTLVLSDSFLLPEEDKWRKQEARIEVQLPEGTTLSLDDHLHPLLGYHKHISGREKIGTLYIMTNEGLVRK